MDRASVILRLPTGRLIVGDPSALFGDARPLDVVLPAGEFPIRVSTSGLQVDFAAASNAAGPLTWAELPGVSVPSGFLALLDASALEEFTDLGDEPIDEYELLSERLRDSPGQPLSYQGLVVCPVPAATFPSASFPASFPASSPASSPASFAPFPAPSLAMVSIGSGSDGTACRLVARFR
jgi:hypothetical protein